MSSVYISGPQGPAVPKTELQLLSARVDAALALHKPYDVEMRDGSVLPHCEECSALRQDYHPYPCATVRLLKGLEK